MKTALRILMNSKQLCGLHIQELTENKLIQGDKKDE